MVASEFVVEAARAGDVVVCGDGEERGTVGAGVLRTLCREHRDEVDIAWLDVDSADGAHRRESWPV